MGRALKIVHPSTDDIKSLLAFYQALGFEELPLDLPLESAATVAAVFPAPAAAPVQREVSGDRDALLSQLREEIGDCQRCKLCSRRKTIVFGAGSASAVLMFIGEAPGKEEDQQGLPFVGDAGILLTRLIEKMGFSRDQVYIANIIKCRPPMNRDPEEDEVAACRGFIERQIEIIRPKAIMTLGRIALQALMNNPRLRITAARGHFIEYSGIKVMPTFHPAYLLRYPKDKILTWADAQKVLSLLGHAAP